VAKSHIGQLQTPRQLRLHRTQFHGVAAWFEHRQDACRADLAFCHTAGLDWDAADALSPMGARAHTAGDIDSLVAQVKTAARPGDHVLCMSNGGFGGVHGKLLQTLK
jgi:UDP-N-acetylmuramate-alanine ligase